MRYLKIGRFQHIFNVHFFRPTYAGKVSSAFSNSPANYKGVFEEHTRPYVSGGKFEMEFWCFYGHANFNAIAQYFTPERNVTYPDTCN